MVGPVYSRAVKHFLLGSVRLTKGFRKCPWWNLNARRIDHLTGQLQSYAERYENSAGLSG